MAKSDDIRVSEDTNLSLPLKNLLGLVAGTAIAVWAYFGIIEKINDHKTRLEIMEKDLELNTEFRIKWPRGLLGALPADSEQFMLIENAFKDIDKIKETQEEGMHNKVNIEFLQTQVKKLQEDVEKLKDSNREMKYQNGNH
jgi:TolA-binding protein